MADPLLYRSPVSNPHRPTQPPTHPRPRPPTHRLPTERSARDTDSRARFLDSFVRASPSLSLSLSTHGTARRRRRRRRRRRAGRGLPGGRVQRQGPHQAHTTGKSVGGWVGGWVGGLVRRVVPPPEACLMHPSIDPPTPPTHPPTHPYRPLPPTTPASPSRHTTPRLPCAPSAGQSSYPPTHPPTHVFHPPTRTQAYSTSFEPPSSPPSTHPPTHSASPLPPASGAIEGGHHWRESKFSSYLITGALSGLLITLALATAAQGVSLPRQVNPPTHPPTHPLFLQPLP